jgi:anti-anti-sigma factor
MSNSPSRMMAASMAVTAGHSACLSLAGDIDLASEPDLDSLASNLAATRCTVVYIDLGRVTFASSSLINFLFRLAGGLPGDTILSVCRPGPMTLQILELTGVHEVATVRADLPQDWAAPWAAAGIGTPIQTAVMA